MHGAGVLDVLAALRRQLLFPEEKIDLNANRLKRELRRLYRAYRSGWLNQLGAIVQGNRAIRFSAANMQLAVKAYVEARGLRFSGGDLGFIDEAVDDAVQRWQRVVSNFVSRTVVSNLDLGVCGCGELRELSAASSSYWSSTAGLVRRMDGLAQDMNFRVVNSAMRMIAPLNGVEWLRWVTQGDDRVCPDCLRAGSGGDGRGYYRISWFMPSFPLHPGCRCEMMLLFYDPRQR